MTERRQLAAIMFSDIAGYTSLMGENESIAYHLLKKNRQIQKPLIEKHGGNWLKEMGDGALVSFQTVTDAVYCAIEIQRKCKTEQDLKLRIGIHLGEVIMEDGDVFGDGVNIASRIEPLAPVGGIYVSEVIFRNIENKEGIMAEFIKEESLKNVKHPVRIYEVDVDGSEIILPNVPKKDAPQKKDIGHTRKKTVYILTFIILMLTVAFLLYQNFYKDKSQSKISTSESREKSIAVLPFRNDSPNNENVYFCNGIMEGILDHLSKIQDLSVVSRTSAEQYRDNPASILEIAQKLGVNYILEGSVLRIGDQAKITAQLIYAPEDRHLWSKQFDKSLEDIFLVLSDVTQAIANDLKATISPELLDRIESVPTTNITAYDYYLQGKEYFNHFLRNRQMKDLTNSEKLYLLALDVDSSFAMAYAGLARSFWERNKFNFYKNQNSLDSVLALCNKAIALDSTSAEAFWVRGSFYDDIMIELDKAEFDLKKAIELNPNHVEAIRHLAFFTAYHRRDYPKALKMLKRAEGIDRSPGELSRAYLTRSSLYSSIGAWDKYLEYRKKANKINSSITVITNNYLIFQGNFQQSIELLNKSKNPNSQSVLYALALNYLILGKFDESLRYFEKWKQSIEEEGEITSSTITEWHRYGEVLVGVGREKEGFRIMRGQLARNDTIRNLRVTVGLLYDNVGICSFLGEKRRAYEYLKQFDGSRRRWDELIYAVQFDPLFDNIRNDEEFIKITARVFEEHKRIRDELNILESLGEI
jgi:adenylate cyclase